MANWECGNKKSRQFGAVGLATILRSILQELAMPLSLTEFLKTQRISLDRI